MAREWRFEMRTYEITTACGDMYFIHENGDIERTDLEGFKPSGRWKMLGLRGVYHGRFTSRFVPLAEVPILLAKGESLRCANGVPRFTIEDLDHGTRRIHGNCKYHGVASIALLGHASLQLAR